MKITVGVFFGGRSVEHEISIISALQTLHAIDKTQYNVVPIYLTKQGIWYAGTALSSIENYKNLDNLLSQCQKIQFPVNANDNKLYHYSPKLFQKRVLGQIDVAFPVFHGAHGEDGCFQGLLELINLPYVGCDVLASAVGMNKIAMKALLKAENLPIVPHTWFYTKNWLKDSESVIAQVEITVPYPLIVKPATLGSSIGVAKVANRQDLESAVAVASKFSQQILIETMVTPLKEVNCAVLGDYEHCEISICEEPTSSADFLSFQDKYLSGSKTKGMSGAKRKIPADITPALATHIQNLAKQTFSLLNAHGVARVDFLVDTSTNTVYINEINTIPGSLSFYLWEASGKSFTALTSQLIQLALKRHREKNNLMFSYDSNVLAGFNGTKGKNCKN